MISTLGAIAVVFALAWIFGGLVLRIGGALIFWVGLVGLATTGNANALLIALLGALAWLVGQGHYALRHGAAKSPAAHSIFAGLAALFRRRCEPATDVRPAPAGRGLEVCREQSYHVRDEQIEGGIADEDRD